MSWVSYKDVIPRDWCHIVRADSWDASWHLVMEVTMIRFESCWTGEARAGVGLCYFYLSLSQRLDGFRLLPLA